MLNLNARQQHVLQYLHQFVQQNQQMPPASHIAADFGWRSPNAASEHLQRLERLGALERNELGNLKISPAGLHMAVVLRAATLANAGVDRPAAARSPAC